MAPLLYKSDMSPPCRAVLLTAKALELELEFKDIDMSNKEHLDEEFVEMNPQHTVPTLDDDGFILIDSHAITTYLVGKYAGDDSLYPADLETRSLIDCKLFFNCGTLQPILKSLIIPIFFQGSTTIPEEVVDKVNETYGTLETSLGDHEYLVGDSVTVADLCVIPSITTINLMVPMDAESFPKLSEYVARMEELPYYDGNSAGLEEFKNAYESLMA